MLVAGSGTGDGTQLTYHASKKGTAELTVYKTPGVVKHGKCAAPTASSSGKACTLLTKVGTFAHADKKGANSWLFTAIVGGKDLNPTTYEMDATAGRRGSVQGTVKFDVLAGDGVPPPSASGTSNGTLIINDGLQTDFPAADGTPLPSGWSSPNRDLVITGGARVQATSRTFAKITISDYAILTLPAGASQLTIDTGDLVVDPTARIDVTGDGYLGGNWNENAPYLAATAPGAAPSGGNSGGSHAGIGGQADGTYPVSGSTYDNPFDPKLPGGGGGDDGCNPPTVLYTEPTEIGGGVLNITAGSLDNSGVIAADGQSGNGPIVTFPYYYNGCGGAGAGGTIQVHAGTLTGNGSFKANGGSTCIATLLNYSDADFGGCRNMYGIGGGGGGGDVLVVSPDHKHFGGTLSAAGGIDLGGPHMTVADATHPTGGTAGSAILGPN
ncbi:MAG: hypothetical protein ACLP8S_03080 [Solirubrobacteraceae bacterium]